MLSQKTDKEIQEILGSRLRAHRLTRNITLEDLARRAGLSKTTLSSMENGADFRISSMLRVLRMLDLLDSADSFLAHPAISPLEIAESLARTPRQRASPEQAGRGGRRGPGQYQVREGSAAAADVAPKFADASGVARIGVPASAPKPKRASTPRNRG